MIVKIIEKIMKRFHFAQKVALRIFKTTLLVNELDKELMQL